MVDRQSQCCQAVQLRSNCDASAAFHQEVFVVILVMHILPGGPMTTPPNSETLRLKSSQITSFIRNTTQQKGPRNLLNLSQVCNVLPVKTQFFSVFWAASCANCGFFSAFSSSRTLSSDFCTLDSTLCICQSMAIEPWAQQALAIDTSSRANDLFPGWKWIAEICGVALRCTAIRSYSYRL